MADPAGDGLSVAMRVPPSFTGPSPNTVRRLVPAALRGGAETSGSDSTSANDASDTASDYEESSVGGSEAPAMDEGESSAIDDVGDQVMEDYSDESERASDAEDRARQFSPSNLPVISPVSDSDDRELDSSWSSYGDIPDILDEYERVVELIDGSENWNSQQRKVHQLIYMRGLHPMIPSHWRMSFKMWGMDQPQLDHVFRPIGNRKRVVISSWGNEHAAAKALESLFTLSQIVHDYDELGEQHRMESTIVKAITNYVKWSLRDAKVHDDVPPLILVEAYPPNITFEDVDLEMTDDDGNESEIDEAIGNAEEDKGEDEDEAEAEKEATSRFIRGVTLDLNRKLRAMGRQWRDLFWDPDYQSPGKKKAIGRYLAEPPTMYGFAVVQHVVMLVSYDAGHADNPVVSIDQISLNDRGLWLWNALSIAIPINIAKDSVRSLQRRITREGLLPGVSAASEDPDI